MIKGIIFDLDGTLGYTLPPMQKAMNEMLRSFDYPEKTVEELLACVNFPPSGWVGGTLPPEARERDLAEAMRRYNEAYGKYYLETEYYAGIEEMLLACKKAGLRLAMQSNKQHEHVVGIAKKLCHLPCTPNDPADKTQFGAVGIFDCTWGVTDRFAPKPAPDAALAIAREWGLDPAEVAYVGDSDVDVNTARNAGMVQVSVTWGYRDRAFHEAMGVTRLADTPRELLGLLLEDA